MRIYRNRDRIRFVVIDNGIGMDKAEVQALYERINGSESSHIGLPNVHRRLTMRYGKESGFIFCQKREWEPVCAFPYPLTQKDSFFVRKAKNDTFSKK